MQRQYLPVVQLGDGKLKGRVLDGYDVSWKRAWYSLISNLTTGNNHLNYFTIPYSDGYSLFDLYGSEVLGGSSSATVKNLESWIMPSSAALSYSDCLNYSVDETINANLIRVRKSISREPFVYETDGYAHQLYLLGGYQTTPPTHYFYWIYFDPTNGITRAPDGYSFIPLSTEELDMWIACSLEFYRVPWNGPLVQDFDINPIIRVSLPDLYLYPVVIPNTTTIFTGQNAFATLDVSNIYGTQQIVNAYLNGVEVNCKIKALSSATTDDDIIIDTLSPSYPNSCNVYWNGSYRASSNLGNLEYNDCIRLYFSRVM